MNGVHDMGGMHGMGPIAQEKDEPVFHTAWEARAYGLTRAMGAWGLWNLDVSRFQRELIAPAEYLRMSYYERWIAGLIRLMLRTKLVTRAEIGSGTTDKGAAALADELRAAASRGEPSDGSRYYHCWLTALEHLVVAKRLFDPAMLLERKNAWTEAYRRTPHGKPVKLEGGQGA